MPNCRGLCRVGRRRALGGRSNQDALAGRHGPGDAARAGELRPVRVPDTTHQAMQGPVRARHSRPHPDKARQQRQASLLRQQWVHGVNIGPRSHRRWLADLRFDLPPNRLSDVRIGVNNALWRLSPLMAAPPHRTDTTRRRAEVGLRRSAFRAGAAVRAVVCLLSGGDRTQKSRTSLPSRRRFRR